MAKEIVFQVTTDDACFGIVSVDGVINSVAPCAVEVLGLPLDEALAHYLHRKAKIVVVVVI